MVKFISSRHCCVENNSTSEHIYIRYMAQKKVHYIKFNTIENQTLVLSETITYSGPYILLFILLMYIFTEVICLCLVLSHKVSGIIFINPSNILLQYSAEMDRTEMDPTEMDPTEIDPTEMNPTEMGPSQMKC